MNCMTPAECGFGPLTSCLLTSPIGDLELVCCSRGVHSLVLSRADTSSSFQPDPNSTVAVKNCSDISSSSFILKQTVKWLHNFFCHQTPKSTDSSVDLPPLCMFLSTNDYRFRTSVLQTLAQSVPFGQTVSYGQLANMCGRKGAARAVGQAMRNNPVMLIVPCHRVVRSDGQCGHYAGGHHDLVKQWLLVLEHERNQRSP